MQRNYHVRVRYEVVWEFLELAPEADAFDDFMPRRRRIGEKPCQHIQNPLLG